MAEFLIKREDGRLLDLSPAILADLAGDHLTPIAGWGTARFRHEPTGVEVVVTDEMPGLQVWCEGPQVAAAVETGIVEGIAQRLMVATGQDVVVIPLG
jgi:hypothetical protein